MTLKLPKNELKGKLPMSRNNITGDKIQTKGVLSKQGEANYDKLFYSCLPDCKYLINTLTKCKLCPHKEAQLASWDETRIDIIGSNGNNGEHYE